MPKDDFSFDHPALYSAHGHLVSAISNLKEAGELKLAELVEAALEQVVDDCGIPPEDD